MEPSNIINQIGHTPLIKLKQVSDLTQCNIYGKAEYLNPGESVKDRAALYIVEDLINCDLSGAFKGPGSSIALSKNFDICLERATRPGLLFIAKPRSVEKPRFASVYGNGNPTLSDDMAIRSGQLHNDLIVGFSSKHFHCHKKCLHRACDTVCVVKPETCLMRIGFASSKANVVHRRWLVRELLPGI